MTDTPNTDNMPLKAHVAFISGPESLDFYGPTIRRLIIGLIDRPMQVSFVNYGNQDTAVLPSPPVDIYHAPQRMWGFWNNSHLESLGYTLVKSGVNILHGLDLQSHSLTRRLSEITSLPYLLSVHKTDHRCKTKPLGSHCFSLLAENISLRDQLLSDNIISDQRVALLPTGIYPEKQVSCFAHEDKNISIIALGQLNDAEVFIPVLQSMAEIRKKHENCSFFILGSGKAEFKLRKIARKLELCDALTFNSSVRSGEVPQIFHYGDIVIYPDADKTLEMNILQAMAAGTAILAANANCSDILIDSHTCNFYPQHNSESLTGKLLELIENKDNAKSMAANAQNYLRENNSPSNMVAQLALQYRNCLLGVS